MPGPLHPLPPGSHGSCSQAQKRARASGCPGGPPSLVQPLSQGTHLGVNLPSAPAAPAAGRRPRTPGPSPAPREPPWVQPPGAGALRLRTFPGPGEATASVAPGRHPSDSRHCWALSLRAAQGPGASGRAEGGAAGGGTAARGGARGVAKTRRGRPPALRALARGLTVPIRHFKCRREGGDGQRRSRARTARGH